MGSIPSNERLKSLNISVHLSLSLLSVWLNTTKELHDRLEGGVVNATGLLAHEAWLEQDFWAAETLRSNGDDVAIRQFVSLLLVTALRCSLHLAVKVQGDVAKFLLEIN